ncbi:hypothetical protein N7495_008101 [Penicillium taxi]|uniref:uncharacterized protein n=1 Tax=Penicillium taxi TaxID=168475 RepID=UPI002545891A|nr:uncharacterized protein N7495_008101 [Penicillium taxi]KAJ5888060.1 hypothetical protein N7495_008101 [Penicillium taxi]
MTDLRSIYDLSSTSSLISSSISPRNQKRSRSPAPHQLFTRQVSVATSFPKAYSTKIDEQPALATPRLTLTISNKRKEQATPTLDDIDTVLGKD